MSTTLTPQGLGGHLKSLDIGKPKMAKANVNAVDIDWSQQIGRAIQRAVSIVGLSHKEAAAKVGVDEAEFSRWLTGVRRPQLDKLLAVEELRWPVIESLARLDERVQVDTLLRRRTA